MAAPAIAEQPRGTVSFLFSDIEGSTRLLQALGSRAYADVLDRHRTLLRQAFRARGGYEVDCEGDMFFVAFQHAGDAVAAAAEAQLFLAHEPWPRGCELRVRIGIHSGEPLLAPPKYVGLAVHTAARIMAAAHGGQVLLTQATRERCSADLPANAVLRDLGEHQLKDLPQPERLHQLVVPGLPHDFPPPRTLTTSRRAIRRPAPALLALAVALLLLLGPGGAPGAVRGTDVLYTTNVDFGRGTFVSVDAGAARDQLGLTASGGMLRLLWLTRDVDNGSSSCTLVKIDSDTGAVLGEYRAVSEGDYCNTNEGWNFALIAVAPNGSAWHARTSSDPAGPTRVGLEELSQCDDRNRNGRIDTSTGLGDIKPWPGRSSLVANAADECILTHVDPSAWGVGGADRFLGVDRSNRLWLQDQEGRYLRFDPATRAGERVTGPMPCDAICTRGHGGREAITPDGNTWRGSPTPTPGEGLHNDGGVLSDGVTFPTAVAVDAAGNVWIHEGTLGGRARRVDPAVALACGGNGCDSGRRLGAYDLTVPLPSMHTVASIVGWMTAELRLPGGATTGTWTVVQDGSRPGRAWRRVSWNGEAEGSVPPGSSLTVEARAAEAVAELDAEQYAPVENGAPFGLAGRFIEVRVSFRRSTGGETPALTDIRIQAAGNSSPVAVDDTLTISQGTQGTVGVLANDSDPDDDPLSVTRSTNGAHGTVNCTPAGACTYAPDHGYGGPDSFTYKVSGGRGGADTASVAVTVGR